MSFLKVTSVFKRKSFVLFVDSEKKVTVSEKVNIFFTVYVLSEQNSPA